MARRELYTLYQVCTYVRTILQWDTKKAHATLLLLDTCRQQVNSCASSLRRASERAIDTVRCVQINIRAFCGCLCRCSLSILRQPPFDLSIVGLRSIRPRAFAALRCCCCLFRLPRSVPHRQSVPLLYDFLFSIEHRTAIERSNLNCKCSLRQIDVQRSTVQRVSQYVQYGSLHHTQEFEIRKTDEMRRKWR